MTSALDFNKPICIVKWTNEESVAVIDPEQAMLIAGESTRFETNHCTANVRCLSARHAQEFGLTINTPVIFVSTG